MQETIVFPPSGFPPSKTLQLLGRRQGNVEDISEVTDFWESTKRLGLTMAWASPWPGPNQRSDRCLGLTRAKRWSKNLKQCEENAENQSKFLDFFNRLLLVVDLFTFFPSFFIGSGKRVISVCKIWSFFFNKNYYSYCGPPRCPRLGSQPNKGNPSACMPFFPRKQAEGKRRLRTSKNSRNRLVRREEIGRICLLPFSKQ